MADTIHQSFGIIFKILQAVRLYSTNPSPCRKLQSFVMYLVCTFMVPILIIVYLIREELDAAQINFSIAFLAQALCLGVKILSFSTKMERIRKCVFYYGDSYFNFHNDEEKKIIDDCINTCRRNTNIFLICLGPGIPVWCIRPMFTKNYSLPLDIWLPFDLSTNTTIYYLLYIILSIVFAIVALTNLVDPLISGLACHTAAQLRVLQYNLQHLGDSFQSDSSHTLYNKIQLCIKHHISIATFIELYEECFSVAIFGQFSATVILLCVFTLQLGMAEGSAVTSIQVVLCTTVVLGQVYFHCYYGTLILEENSNLTKSVYMGQWYDYDIASRKSLILLMERSKKPMLLTAGKVVEMSVDTFTVILKRSYSLLAVLKNY